jgi:hypothetical protein
MCAVSEGKLDDLVTELVATSGPRIQPGSQAAHVNLNWGSEKFGTVREDGDEREVWARRVRSLCGQIFMQGHGAGWDKHVAVVEERERERRYIPCDDTHCIFDGEHPAHT